MRTGIILVATVLMMGCTDDTPSARTENVSIDTLDVASLLRPDAQAPYDKTTEHIDSVDIGNPSFTVRLRWQAAEKGPHKYVSRVLAEYPARDAGESVSIEPIGAGHNAGTRSARIHVIGVIVKWVKNSGGTAEERAEPVFLSAEGKRIVPTEASDSVSIVDLE